MRIFIHVEVCVCVCVYSERRRSAFSWQIKSGVGLDEVYFSKVSYRDAHEHQCESLAEGNWMRSPELRM